MSESRTHSNTWALIPVKEFTRAKSRLRAYLGAKQCALLAREMLRMVLSSLSRTSAVDHIIVLSSDAAAESIAKKFGARFAKEKEIAAGLNDALNSGVNLCWGAQAEKILIVPSDIPLIRPRDVTRILDASADGCAVICPDRRKSGTNALLLHQSNSIDFCYGAESFWRHRQEFDKKKIKATTVDLPHISFDIDTADDFEDLASFSDNGMFLHEQFASKSVILNSQAADRTIDEPRVVGR